MVINNLFRKDEPMERAATKRRQMRTACDTQTRRRCINYAAAVLITPTLRQHLLLRNPDTLHAPRVDPSRDDGFRLRCRIQKQGHASLRDNMSRDTHE